MARIVKEIIKEMNRLAPPALAMSWDAIGLQIGSMDAVTENIYVALDLNLQNLEEAIAEKCQLIITHHPVIFSPLKTIRTDEPEGRLITSLLNHQMSVFVAHTNMDIAVGGLNDWVSQKLQLRNISLLETTGQEDLLKLVVFVPEESVDDVADALLSAGAGHIGNYSHCTFRVKGTGTFKPLDGSTPAIGQHNQIESVAEVRLETIIPAPSQSTVIEAMIKAHPYEEVAYDLITLKNQGAAQGIGRIGELDHSESPVEWIDRLKAVFNVDSLRWVAGNSREIKKVAVLTGSGASGISAAITAGCDALVTGDIKYHDAQQAQAAGLHLFDVGHFETEQCFVTITEDFLKRSFSDKGWQIKIIADSNNKSPFEIV
jgi:dinuclear metal center YbgI/SA1388 family protein